MDQLYQVFRVVVKRSSNLIKGINCAESILATFLWKKIPKFTHFPEPNEHKWWFTWKFDDDEIMRSHQAESSNDFFCEKSQNYVNIVYKITVSVEIIKNIHERYSFIHYNFSTNQNHSRNFIRIETIFGSCEENSIHFIWNVSIYCHAHFACKMVLLIGSHAVIAVDWTTNI